MSFMSAYFHYRSLEELHNACLGWKGAKRHGLIQSGDLFDGLGMFERITATFAGIEGDGGGNRGVAIGNAFQLQLCNRSGRNQRGMSAHHQGA